MVSRVLYGVERGGRREEGRGRGKRERRRERKEGGGRGRRVRKEKKEGEGGRDPSILVDDIT